MLNTIIHVELRDRRINMIILCELRKVEEWTNLD